MRIGELARRAGVHVQTVHFYERLKLLRAPPRSPSGYRLYEASDLARVQFIRRTQDLGFSLKEIRQLVSAHAGYLQGVKSRKRAEKDLRLIVELFERKKAAIEAQMGELDQLHGKLCTAINQLQNPTPLCPINNGDQASQAGSVTLTAQIPQIDATCPIERGRNR